MAISVDGDAQWAALGNAVGHPELIQDARFATGASRQENQVELDRIIELWTLDREPWEATEALQAAGVAAAPVLDSAEVLRDPHLTERGFVAWVDHPETGRRPIGTVSWSINGQRRTEYRPAPRLGEHNQYVFGELLNVPEEELERHDRRRGDPVTLKLVHISSHSHRRRNEQKHH